tara:strand:+ start:231 stop:695 length:465 start_codon:yes stop_codon:yes gene_type:complete
MLDLYTSWYFFSEKYFYLTLPLKHSIKARVEVTFSDTEGGRGLLKLLILGWYHISIFLKKRRSMDKFTKGILTVIAVGIIGLNVQIMNDGGFITKAHSYEPHSHKSLDIIDIDYAIQDQLTYILGFVEDCKIEEGFGNDYSSGGSPLNTYDIRC